MPNLCPGKVRRQRLESSGSSAEGGARRRRTPGERRITPPPRARARARAPKPLRPPGPGMVLIQGPDQPLAPAGSRTDGSGFKPVFVGSD